MSFRALIRASGLDRLAASLGGEAGPEAFVPSSALPGPQA